MRIKLMVLLFSIFTVVQAQVPSPKLWWASGDSLYPVHNNIWVKGDSLEFDYAEFDSLVFINLTGTNIDITGWFNADSIDGDHGNIIQFSGDSLDFDHILLGVNLLGPTALGVLDTLDVDHISGTTTIDPGGTLTITGENIIIDEPGAGVPSPYVYWTGDHGGVTERAAIRLVQGVDPYMEILVDDDNTGPALISVLKVHDTMLLFSTDNATDIGATGATRPKDLYLAGNLQEVVDGNFSGDLDVDGAVTFDSTLIVAEAATLNGAATFNGKTTFTLVTELSGEVSLGDLFLTNGAKVDEFDDGRLNSGVWTCTITHDSLSAVAVAEDVLMIDDFPAKYRIIEVFIDVREVWDDAAGPMSACTISMGWTAANYDDLMQTEDIFTAVTQLGDAAGEINYTAVQGGIRPSWSAVTDIYLRFVATGANLSTLTTGEMTVYITYQSYGCPT